VTGDEIRFVIELWLGGRLTADQAMRILAADLGMGEGSGEIGYLSWLVKRAAGGRVSIDQLMWHVARLEEGVRL
jgi:hypothetical protein